MIKFTKEQEIEICSLYSKNSSLENIATIFRVCRQVIKKVILKNDITIRSSFEFSRKHSVNENYFEKIDTIEKAYFFGLLCADGSITPRGFRLKLKEDDIDIIKKFKLSLESEHPITYIKYPNDQNQYDFRVHSLKMKNDLQRLGCTKNKSLTLKFPDNKSVPVEFMSHFLRGIFCGDGSISNRRCKRGYTHYTFDFTGSVEFITDLRKYIYNKFGFKGYARTITNKNEYARLVYNSYNEILILASWLYNDCSEYKIDRKYNRYLTMKDNKNRLFYSHYRKNNKNYKRHEYKIYGQKCSSKKIEFV